MDRSNNGQRLSRELVWKIALDVGHRVIDYPMSILALKSVVGFERVAIQRRSRFDLLADLGLKGLLLPVCNDNSPSLAGLAIGFASGIPITAVLSFPPVPVVRRAMTFACILRALAPMNVSSTSTRPDNFANETD